GERNVHVPVGLIEQRGVTVKERPAAAVLPDQPNVKVVREKRRVSEVLGEAPVEIELARGHPTAIVDDALNPRMQLEIRRHAIHRLRETLQLRHRHAGLDGLSERGLLIAAPVDRVLIAEHAERVLVRVAALVETLAVGFGYAFDFFLRSYV